MMMNCGNARPVLLDVKTSDSQGDVRTNQAHHPRRMTHRDLLGSHMLIGMPDQSSVQDLELPHPRRLIWTALWNMAESLGLPFGAWMVVTDLAGRNPGLLAGLGVVWLLIVVRKA